MGGRTFQVKETTSVEALRPEGGCRVEGTAWSPRWLEEREQSETVVRDGRGILCGIGRTLTSTKNKVGVIGRFMVYLGFDRITRAVLLKINCRTQR